MESMGAALLFEFGNWVGFEFVGLEREALVVIPLILPLYYLVFLPHSGYMFDLYFVNSTKVIHHYFAFVY